MTQSFRTGLSLLLLAAFLVTPAVIKNQFGQDSPVPKGKQEVIFWHFWGGKDRDVVADVVRRFNSSQDQYWVREIAMPGNNLQAKLFLSTTGGSPPDLVNQDDPILADWAKRGVIQPISKIAPKDELAQVQGWLFQSARRLSEYDGQLYGICNGLDIRAMYYNESALDEFGCRPPQTIQQLDQLTEKISPAGKDGNRDFYAYLPDSRRLWAWGYVFGGKFYNAENSKVTVADRENISALKWMASYSKRYGAENIAAFRTGDQTLPGKSFRLLPATVTEETGRYLLLMDGQWRTRDIKEFNAERVAVGLKPIRFGVCPLPYPEDGKQRAGWVNGNFFVIPKGAKNAEGAWAFIKFWIGLEKPEQAAKTCANGGWIPVGQSVVDTPDFQQFLKDDPLFAKFVELAASKEQYPVPVIPGAPMFKRTIEAAAYEGMNHPEGDIAGILENAQKEIQEHLDRLKRTSQ